MKYIDADRMKAKLDEHYRKYQSKYMETRNPYTEGIIDALDLAEQVIDSLQQEQPEQPTMGYDEAYLNEKIAKATESWKGVDVDKFMDEMRGREPEEDLEKEISTWIPAHISGGDDGVWKNTKNVIIEWAGIVARHFAEWGAEHLAGVRKMIDPETDLEEAAEKEAWKRYPNYPSSGWGTGDYQPAENWESDREVFIEGFKFGAKWMQDQFEKNRLAHCDKLTKEEYDLETDFATEIIEKEHRQPTFTDAINYGMRVMKEHLMKEAVEGIYTKSIDGDVVFAESTALDVDPKSVKVGDKVKLIVLKAEEE